MSALSHIRILVVDDHKEMAQLMALMLRRNGVDVLLAQDGVSGLKKALEKQPDVVITDLMMPNMDGFTLMEKILEDRPHTPIIVVTAYGSMKSAVRALRLGAFDFITKPFDKTDIRNTVAKAARQEIANKRESWRQKIIDALSISRDPIQLGEKFLSLTADALGAEHGLIWWSEEITPPLLLHPIAQHLVDDFIVWAKAAGLNNQINGQQKGICFKPVQAQGEDIFSGSLIGTPLVAHDNLKGTLILAHSQADYFDTDDTSFLESLAPFAAMAIDNAQTYTKLKISNDKLASLQRISTLTYNANLPFERILRLVAEGIRQNLNYPGVTIWLPEQETGNLTIRSAAGDLDKILRRYGDMPTRYIVMKLGNLDNPLIRAYQTRKIQEAPIQTWITYLEEAQASDMAQAIAKLKKVARYIFLPLWQGEEVIGILGIGYFRDAPPAPEEWNLLTSVANQASLIIKNSALYQAEQQGRREMEALYQAGLVITSSLSHSEVLRTIIEQIVDLTQFESCIIGRWDKRKDAEVIELYLQKTPSGWIEREPSGTVYSLVERPLVSEALQRRQLKVIKPDDPGLPLSEQAWMAQTLAQLRLIIPLIVRNNTIGVLELVTAHRNRRFTPHVSRITQGLAAQAAIALENARLHESEIKRVEQEMDLAHRIQVSLLPHETPQVPGMTIAARSVSARLVGGDFYRYLSLPNGQFGVVVGDISGKGVPSALYMAMTITAMDTQVRQHTSPGDMLRQLNTILYPRMQANRMNAALLIAIFNANNGSLQVANAGMIAPLIKQRHQYDWLDVAGLPLGAIPNVFYTGQTVSLTRRSTIILASDGLIEAQNHIGEMFGFERFRESAQGLQRVAGSQQILESIWQDVSTHIGDAEPHDDMTLVVIQTWGRSGGTRILSSSPEFTNELLLESS